MKAKRLTQKERMNEADDYAVRFHNWMGYRCCDDDDDLRCFRNFMKSQERKYRKQLAQQWRINLQAKVLLLKALLETGRYGKGCNNDELIELFDNEVLK